MQIWQTTFENWWHENESDDASHDLGHFRRVYLMALRIADGENADTDGLVMMAAAYFHDVVNPPKDSPLRTKASGLAAEKAREILTQMKFPEDKLEAVAHAIKAHSFSAGFEAKTLEAKIIQDSDRMESLGAMGVCRNMYVSGRMGSALFHADDIMGENRELNDAAYALDHFELKLLKLPNMMQTKTGKEIAQERADFLVEFRKRLIQEITGEI